MKALIKNIFFDIVLLYKNFFRWNFEKIKISIFSFLLGVLVSIPFFLTAGIIAYFSNIEWMRVVSSLIYENSLILDIISNNVFTFFSVSLFFILGIISLLFGIFYSVVLLFKLSLNFMEGNYKLKIKKDYFNINRIFNFFKILNLNSLILFGIFLIYLLLMFILITLFGGMGSIQIGFLGGSKVFSIISLILFIIFTIVLFYTIYRLIFSFIILVDDKTNKGSIDCIKKSYKLTSSKLSLFRFIVMGLILLLISLPFGTYSKYLDYTYLELQDYSKYSVMSDDLKAEMLKGDRAYYYNKLNIDYSSYNKNKINSELLYFKNMQKIYFIFSFLFLYGIFYMFLVSFYTRELKKSGEHFKGIKSFIKKVKEHKVL